MNLKDAGIYDLINIFKGEATSSHNTSQGGIINSKSRIINIPAYQRPYRWRTDNITRLFEDYDENSEEYFLGSAVAVEKDKDDLIEFDIVDGQQRITTLYLINYIRFLLKKEYVYEKLKKPYQPKSSELCNGLKLCYVNMVGKSSKPFDNILNKIEELAENDELDPNDRVEQLINCYRTELCYPDVKSTVQETAEERINKAREFFKDEQLCLKYSRTRYDSVLRDALCNVYLKNPEDTTNYELATVFNHDENEDDKFSSNYLNAMKTIFNSIWDRAKIRVENVQDASLYDICEAAIFLTDEIINNMSMCIVLTENENDANKLFEVLNDRSLEVEDLELIKNHFYKEYCTKSNDVDDVKDKNITKLDELWADKIFSGNSENRNRLISYLAAVYLTCDKDLVLKDDAKLKDAIEKNYSSKKYKFGIKNYEYENVLSDFNTYYAIKIIMESFNVKAIRLNQVSLDAEQEQKSITYKVVHLLNALKYHAVIPALTNVIVSTYAQSNSLTDPDFENKFRSYIKNVMEDKSHSNPEFEKIHKCAFMLWTAAVKGADYTIAREIAKRIIGKYGAIGYSNDSMDFLGSEITALDTELDKWLAEWTYSSNKTFIVKVLLLHLLLSGRTTDSTETAYKARQATLNFNAQLTYTLDGGKLQLDHLEAASMINGREASYYLANDVEKRQKDVNGYLGNFMILDATDNNKKNNVPMCEAMAFYNGIKNAWLVEDISYMMKDSIYFDLAKNVPKEAFFKERSKRLKYYIKAFLNRELKDEQRDVTFY